MLKLRDTLSAMRDVPTLFREEFVSDMVLKFRSPILVLTKDVTSCCLILSILKIIRYACHEISINKYNMHTRMVP